LDHAYCDLTISFGEVGDLDGVGHRGDSAALYEIFDPRVFVDRLSSVIHVLSADAAREFRR
jgi:hypothetical protein